MLHRNFLVVSLKKHVLFFVLLASVVAAFADDRMAAANELYIKNKYQEAASAYQSVQLSGYVSHELFFNLGNTYYKLGENTKAILNYERALLLLPNDEATLANLQIANRKVVDKVEVAPEFFLNGWFRTVYLSLTSDTWAVLSMVFFTIFLACMALYLLSSNRKARILGFSSSIFMVIFTAFFMFMAAVHSDYVSNHKTAIVVNPSLTVTSAPAATSTQLFVLHEGTKVKILSKVEGWFEVQLADGKVGWAQHSDLEVI